ncbi:MAG: flagellar basal body rod protein FlgB [Methylococcales bacterium]|nr:flagellar basal body rod protein FlgB [Methylococcales bacterium]
MAINFDSALGIHPQALILREKRSEILASNLANVDTPHYKAKDLDFRVVLQHAKSVNNEMVATDKRHFFHHKMALEATVMFRNPYQASLDGNTVEPHIEQAKYAENAVQYQASLRFINSKFSGLMSAIKGQ